MFKRIAPTLAVAIVTACILISYELEVWSESVLHMNKSATVSQWVTYLSAIAVVVLARFSARGAAIQRSIFVKALPLAMIGFLGTVITVCFDPSEGILTSRIDGFAIQQKALAKINDINYCYATSIYKIDFNDEKGNLGASLLIGPWMTLITEDSLKAALFPLPRCSLNKE